jgi:hypothetical protein
MGYNTNIISVLSYEKKTDYCTKIQLYLQIFAIENVNVRIADCSPNYAAHSTE